EIGNPRPLIPAALHGVSPEAREVVETFRALASAARGGHRDALRTYVISGTQAPSDVLEVLLLMKETGLAAVGGGEPALGITPLFESGDALAAQPMGTVAGRITFTEQGEVVTAKYAAREMAHRELERVAGAVLMSTAAGNGQAPAAYATALDRIAAASRAAYRDLVYGDPA